MTLIEFVKKGIAENKTTKEIFEGAIKEGFKTSNGSVRVLTCNVKKTLKTNEPEKRIDSDNNDGPEL